MLQQNIVVRCFDALGTFQAAVVQVTTVFVGGLRKTTTEDKVAAHFAKYGQASSLRVQE